jgi:hypothetical protein
MWWSTMAERHRFDPGAPIAGLYFLGLAVFFLAGALAGEPVRDLAVLSAAIFIGLGAVGMALILSRGRRRELPDDGDQS